MAELTDEQKLARKRERRKARREARKEIRAEAKAQGVALPRRGAYHGPLLRPDEYLTKLVGILGLEPSEPKEDYWSSYSLSVMQETYPDPSEAAKFILARMATFEIPATHYVVMTGRLFGVGPVYNVGGRPVISRSR